MSSKVFGDTGLVFAPGRRSRSAVSMRAADRLIPYKDSINGGAFMVTGTAAVAGTPDILVERLILLCDKKTKRPIRSTISAVDGTYEFGSVAKGPWFVIGFDHTDEYNAVIADNIFGTPM